MTEGIFQLIGIFVTTFVIFLLLLTVWVSFDSRHKKQDNQYCKDCCHQWEKIRKELEPK
jgi:cbb3-type cytochrome oxidase subunit 3